eukprot:4837557-Pyramimonas_sp.AAC.1
MARSGDPGPSNHGAETAPSAAWAGRPAARAPNAAVPHSTPPAAGKRRPRRPAGRPSSFRLPRRPGKGHTGLGS